MAGATPNTSSDRGTKRRVWVEQSNVALVAQGSALFSTDVRSQLEHRTV